MNPRAAGAGTRRRPPGAPPPGPAGRQPPSKPGPLEHELAAALADAAASTSVELVLRHVLLHPDDMTEIAGLCSPADISHTQWQVIAAAIWDMHAAGAPIDPVTVAAELERAQQLELAGGREEINRLIGLTGVSANATHHAREVRRLARQRRRAAVAADLMAAAVEDDGRTFERLASELTELIDDAPADGRIESRMLTLEQLRALPEPDWLIEGVLSLDSLAMLFGKRGAKKSFAIVDLLMRASVGGRWHGRQVRPTRGLYVVGEGTPLLAQRFDAWQATYPQYRTDVTIYPDVVNLMSTIAVADFAAVAARLGFQFIVFDTLARMMVGGDENSTKDAGIVVDNLERIRRATGACVTVVHHAGYADNGRGRGSTAFEAAMDTVLGLADVDGVLTLSNSKQKNATEARPMRLDAQTVHLPPAEDGRPRSSLVLVEYAGTDIDQSTAATAKTLQALADIELPGGIPNSRWMDAAEQPKSTFSRHLRKLVDLGLVRNVGTDRSPRYATVAALEAADPEQLDLGA